MGAVAAVVFDWYGTLGTPGEGSSWGRLPDLVVAAGGNVSDEALEEWATGYSTDHREHSTSEDRYHAWQRERSAELLRRCGLSEGARDELLELLQRRRLEQVYDIFPDVTATLAELRRRSVVVGVCSNWDWDLERHLARNGILELFDFVVCSASFGYRKPHPAIFATVLDRSGAQPGDVLFIGDTWSEDITGATAAGLRAVHIARTGDSAVAEHGEVPCVADFAGLLRLLEASDTA